MKKLSSILNNEQREWLLLISACLVNVVAGQAVSGAVFTNYMKSSFGLNQRQLDFCIALMFFGTILIFISGFFYDKFGSRASVLMSGVFSTLMTACLTVSMAYPETLRHHLWLLYILLFLYGHSTNYSYMAATACCMTSFPNSRRAYIMCLMDHSFCLGLPLVALIYYVIFGNTHRSKNAQEPIGTLVVMSVFTAVVHAFAFFFLTPLEQTIEEMNLSRPILQQANNNESTAAVGNTANIESAAGENSESKIADEFKDIAKLAQNFLDSCCSISFIPLLLGFTLAFAPNQTFLFNVTSVNRSLGLTQYDVYYFWFPMLSGVLFRTALGPLIDRYLSEAHQRSASLLFCLACFGTPSALMMCLPLVSGVSPVGVTMTANILAALTQAALFTLFPVIISLTQPHHLFGRLFSAGLMMGTILILPLMLQFGALYDSNSFPLTGRPGNDSASRGIVTTGLVEYECTGQACYVYGGIANTVSYVLASVSLTYYTISLM